MNVLTRAREELHASLADVFVEPVRGYAFDGRVLPYRPSRASAPLVWLDDSSSNRSRAERAWSWAVTFPVWVVHDGTVEAQVAGVEEIIGRVYDAARAARFTVLGHDPSPLPAELVQATTTNPPRLRAAVVSITTGLVRETFCPPPDSEELTP